MPWRGPARHCDRAQSSDVRRIRSRRRTRCRICSLIVRAQLNDADPQAWLATVLARVGDHRYTSSKITRVALNVNLKGDRRMRSLTLSATEKAAITAACQAFIETVLKPRFLPSVMPTSFNCAIDIQGKWHGSKYRFLQRYRSGFEDNRGKEFDAPFVRLDWTGPDRFDVQWHRHTGQWFRTHQSLTLKAALAAMINNGVLHPP